METKHDTVPILQDTDLTVVRQLGGDRTVPRDGGERETLPLRSHLSTEIQRERDLYIRGLHCLNDNDVACARLYFQLAAERFRSGRSAIAMGDTFNPRRLKERRIYGGVQPDISSNRAGGMSGHMNSHLVRQVSGSRSLRRLARDRKRLPGELVKTAAQSVCRRQADVH